MFKRFLKIVLSFFIILSIVPVDIYANNKNDSEDVYKRQVFLLFKWIFLGLLFV